MSISLDRKNGNCLIGAIEIKSKLNKEIVFFVFLAFIVRLLSTNHEYPPFSFCDEDIILNEISRLNSSGSWVTEFYLSGGLNIYLPLIFAKILAFIGIHDTNLYFISRLIGTVFIGALTVVFQYLITLEISKNKATARISSLIFIFSPAVYALSRYFYPDHWIYFFSSAAIYFSIRSAKNPNFNKSLTLGIFIGLTASLKYTGFVLVLLPCVIWIIQVFRPQVDKKILKSNLSFVISVVSSLITFSIVNFSIFINTSDFSKQFFENTTGYEAGKGNFFEGFSYYLLVILVLCLGIFGFLFAYLGCYSLWKTSRSNFALLIVPALAYIVIMGSAVKVLNRNISIIFPIIFTIMAFGIKYLFDYLKQKMNVYFSSVLMALLLIQPIFGFIFSFAHDFKTDSRIIASSWLKKNISPETEIGIEGSCWPASPAQTAGFVTAFNGNYEFNFPFQVSTSYWSKNFTNYERSNSLYQILLDQKYIHFYNYNDKRMFFRIFEHPNLTDFLPPQYEIYKIFDSNGPVVFVLKLKSMSK